MRAEEFKTGDGSRMKKLLEDRVILTHITGYAGPAACLPMRYAFNMEIPEFGYSYVEDYFYPPFTNVKIFGDYTDTWITYPVMCTEEYAKLMKEQNRWGGRVLERDDVKIDARGVGTLKYLCCSFSDAIEAPFYNEKEGGITVMYDNSRNGMEDGYISKESLASTASRIINSFTIGNVDGDIMKHATHYICIRLSPVRNVVSLFRKKMSSDLHQEPAIEDDGLGMCEGARYSRYCRTCWWCRMMDRYEENEALRDYYESNIIDYWMRDAIIWDMYQYSSTHAISDRDLDRSFRLRHWYWKISGCDAKSLNIGYDKEYNVGYRDNFGILTLDELMWKMKKYDDLKSFIRFRDKGRDCGKTEDNLLSEFLEVDEGYMEYVALWWLLHSGAILPDEYKHMITIYEVEDAMKYEMYDEARTILEFISKGEEEICGKEFYDDVRRRLGL